MAERISYGPSFEPDERDAISTRDIISNQRQSRCYGYLLLIKCGRPVPNDRHRAFSCRLGSNINEETLAVGGDVVLLANSVPGCRRGNANVEEEGWRRA